MENSVVIKIFSEDVQEKISDIIDNQNNISFEISTKNKETKLKITSNEKDVIQVYMDKIKERFGDCIFATEDISLEEVVSKMIIKKKMTLSVAESCTGGMVSSTFINYPGISSIFYEGVVTYSNEAKIDRLGVKKESLDKYGAVSEVVAKEMAQGLKTDIGISTTGIAGPGGGTLEKEVGLVYIGICINDNTTVKKYNFKGSRDEIRLSATKNAINDLRLRLL